MKKDQLIALVAGKAGCTAKAAGEVLAAFAAVTTEALLADDEVSIPGFGSFSAALQKGKSGKVPGTDKQYKTSDKMVARFKAAKSLKDSLAAKKIKAAKK